MTSAFFNLPLEMRELIYEYSLDTDDNPGPFASLLKVYPDAPFRRVPTPSAEQILGAAYGRNTFASLRLTCKAISSEAQALVARNEHLRRWECELAVSQEYDTTHDFYDPDIVPDVLIWTRIPCSPKYLETLSVKFVIPPHFKETGTTRLISMCKIFFDTLNRFIFYGPTLHPNRPLDSPIKLRNLELKPGVYGKGRKLAMGTKFYSYLEQIAWLMSKVGSLYGIVDHVHANQPDEPRVTYDIAPWYDEAWRAICERYGFAWKVPVAGLNSCQDDQEGHEDTSASQQ